MADERPGGPQGNSQGRQVGGSKWFEPAQRPEGPAPPAPSSQRPGRFTLRELCVLTALVALTAALFTWARVEPIYAGPLFIAALVSVIAFGFHMATRRPPVEIIALLAILIPFGCFFLLPIGRSSPEPARRMRCSNHLKQIGLALQNYHDTYGSFPPAYIADASGKPIHSWRVLILPFMEQKPLYDKYRFDEPWDGPNNSKLHNEIVDVFC